MNVASQELEIALSLLRAGHKDHATQLLRDHRLASTGSRDELIERVRTAIDEGHITLDELVTTLDAIEEHGHQHVFLFRIPEAMCLELADQRHVRRAVADAGLSGVFNARTRVVGKPRRRTCTSIRHDAAGLRLKWVERRVWEERLQDRDRLEGDVLLRGFRQHEARAVDTLRLSLVSGDVELRISDAGKVTRKDYAGRLAAYTAETDWLVDWDSMQKVSVVDAIPHIKLAKDEVRVRANTFFTARGMKASFTSDAASSDLRADPVYQAGDTAAEGEGQDHRLLNVYWLPRAGIPLSREIHTYLYADGEGNEMRIPADCNSDETDYVLSRIRHFAGA